MTDEERRDLAPRENKKGDLALPPISGLDLSSLPEEQRNALIERAGQTQIDLSKRNVELQQDLNAMSDSLETMTDSVGKMAEKGVAATVTQRRQDNLGTTEVIAGNTEAAKSGKMPRSVTGEFNWTPVLIIVGILAVLILVALIANR